MVSEPGAARQASASVPELAGAGGGSQFLHATGPSGRDVRAEGGAAGTAGAPAGGSRDQAAASDGVAMGQGADAPGIPEACGPAGMDVKAAPGAASTEFGRGDDAAGAKACGAVAMEAAGLPAEGAEAGGNGPTEAEAERCEREWVLEHVRLPNAWPSLSVLHTLASNVPSQILTNTCL